MKAGMNKFTALIPAVLLSSLIGLHSTVRAETGAPADNSQQIINRSVDELATSVLNALTLGAFIIYAQDLGKDRDRIIEGIDALDKGVDFFVYPPSVYQVISDAKTREKIQSKNKSRLFNSLSQSARVIYSLGKSCFSPDKMVKAKIIGSPLEDKKQKTVAFDAQFGRCPAARIVLSDVTNIDGKYYFADISAAKTSSKLSATTTREATQPGQGTAIPFQFEVAGLFKSGVAPAKQNGVWGLIEKQAKWLVKPQYKEIGRLSEGLIAVEKEGKFAFIHATLDAPGKPLTRFKYDKAHYFSDSLAGVKVGAKWGFINKQGKLQIPPKYENIRNFKQGFAPVRVNKKWGYINTQGKWLVKPVYDAAYSFTDDALAVVVIKNKRGYIDTRGRFVIKPSYRRVQRFSEGVAPVSKKKNSWFFINKQNKVLFPKQFSQVRIFSEGITAVMNNDKKWGYIDKTGKLRINYQFDRAYDFKEGLALVRKGDKRGFVNKQGDIVIPMIYDDAFRFSEGLAPVKKEGLWGYILKP